MFANRIFHQEQDKNDRIDQTLLKITNELVQHLRVVESTSRQWVNVQHPQGPESGLFLWLSRSMYYRVFSELSDLILYISLCYD